MISKFFKIHELVPKILFETIHEEVLWRMIPDEIIESIDAVKARFSSGIMTINNYFWGGDREWSGLRLKGSPFYSEGSLHSLFEAFDAVFSDYDAQRVRDYIVAHPDEFPHIRRLEGKVSWLHADIKETNTKKIVLFNA
jgi:hypothetical protein